MIETHAHVYSNKFQNDTSAMIDRALQAGVEKIYMPNVDIASIDGMLKMEAAYPGVCLPMMGLHPCSVDENYEAQLAVIHKWLEERKFWAVGEIGLDLYWDKAYFEQQKDAFLRQISWAKQLNLPIVVHVREAMDQTIEILKQVNDTALRGIIHCFTGTLDQARQLIDMNFHLGIGGVVTYKNGGLEKVIPHVPLDRLVLETDSPYLAPVPFRGKRNEPAYLTHIADRIAFLKQVDTEAIVHHTTENAAKIFGQ